MRGKQLPAAEKFERWGITPAHAGKTTIYALAIDPRWDHPRACGENNTIANSASFQQGSPPRMRGKHPRKALFYAGSRITPAHAGKTAHNHLAVLCDRDHPRACGENMIKSEVVRVTWGSPPRMRGKHRRRDGRHLPVGITPAHAGKTLRKGRISVVDPSPQPRSSLTSRRADASIGSQRAPCAAPV